MAEPSLKRNIQLLTINVKSSWEIKSFYHFN